MTAVGFVLLVAALAANWLLDWLGPPPQGRLSHVLVIIVAAGSALGAALAVAGIAIALWRALP